jgi:O-acetyl-ADP-ribose deacetylase (regulator of RNase III)
MNVLAEYESAPMDTMAGAVAGLRGMTMIPATIARRIHVIRGDITKLSVDAIVNAANEGLLGGGGVDGAIHRAAGSELQDECRKLHGCQTGAAKITKGFRLPASYVIHTVGPVWSNGRSGEPALLRSCYDESLKLAESHKLKTIAFPCISTGVYGYPKQAACKIAVAAAVAWLTNHEVPGDVTFCCFGEDDRLLYERECGVEAK